MEKKRKEEKRKKGQQHTLPMAGYNSPMFKMKYQRASFSDDKMMDYSQT